MSSRRLMTRSYSGEGRTGHHNGDEGNGTNRPGSRSYLSNVRPESSPSSHRYSQYRPPRSTFCSVMAQLTEETQPSFEITLKSKAVSETRNVKFSCVVTGHPTPQVLWYKDDMQLDRYCGLPKYEIFREGQNHSLHIYNCTVDDAAIYQASAANSKGIVSCSGVLEVGVMNEYRIHERYFAKLKQKAESKRRELEGKENQGPGLLADLRSISPDRPQRKRRSTTEPGLSPPSSMEDEGIEESCRTSAAEAEARVQETKTAEVTDNTTPITNGAVPPIVNGQATKDNANAGNLYMYDSVKKTFTAHQPKTPFAKKKKKISNGTGNIEVETPIDVPEARGASEETGVAPAFIEALVPHGPPEVVMEVENTASPKVLASNCVKVTERRQRAVTDKAMPIKKVAAGEEKVQMKTNVDTPPHKEQPAVAVLPIPGSVSLSSGNSGSSETESKQAVGPEKDQKARHTEKAENCKLQIPSPPIISTQLLSRPGVKPSDPSDKRAEEHIPVTKRDRAAVIEFDEKPTAAGPQRQTTNLPNIEGLDVARDLAAAAPQGSQTFPHEAPVCLGPESAEPPRECEDALPQRELFGHQLSVEETTRGQKNASASQRPQLAEVTRAHTQAKRNEAPVGRELLPTRGEMDVRSPQRPPSGGEAMPDDNQTPTLHSPEQLASDKMTQGTWNHSKGSNESHAAPFTDVQKSPLENQGDGENTKGCNVSIPAGQSQVEMAIKTVEEMEIQAGKKVDGGEEGGVQAQGHSLVCDEGKVEVETQVVSQNMTEQAKIERTADAPRKDSVSTAGTNVLYTETENSLPVLKDAHESPAPLRVQNVNPTTLETVIPCKTKNLVNATFQNMNMSEQPIDPNKEKENPPLATKVMSIAELLRSQIKALGLTATDSLAAESPTPEDSTPYSTSRKKQHATDNSPELRTDHSDSKLALEKPKLAMQMETKVNGCPPSNIVAPSVTVAKQSEVVCRQKAEHISMKSLNAGIQTAEAKQKALATPLTSIKQIRSPSEEKLPGSMAEVNDNVMDTGKESVPLKDNASSPLSGTKNTQVDFSTIAQSELSHSVPPVSNRPVIHSLEPRKPLANTPVEMDSGNLPPTKVSSQQNTLTSGFWQGSDNGVQSESPNLSPDMQPASEAHVRSTQTASTTSPDQDKEHKPNAKGLQTKPACNAMNALGLDKQQIDTPHVQSVSSVSTTDAHSKNDQLTSLTDSTSKPLLKIENGTSPIPSATPQELASGARRKILIPKPRPEDTEPTSPAEPHAQTDEVNKKSSVLSPSPNMPSLSPNLLRRSPLLQPPSDQQTPPAERKSPLMNRKRVTVVTSRITQEPQHDTPKSEEKPTKDKHDPFKAPQVIRKIRGEPFSDALGHLKLWCQFFNVLGDSNIKWYRDEVEIADIKRSAGDETQVALAIVQASSRDCGVYGCTITNQYGSDSTDFLLSVDILAGMYLREDLDVGEEIEVTPLVMNKGLADSGAWGNKFFGRVMMKESHVGEGCSRKAWRAKVIYGLEPLFESGVTCVIKVRNPIAYGGKEESNLVEKNQEIARQECRIQNVAREYCKIFSAEARVIENFGAPLEVIPVYVMYRPANTVPYATVEADLQGLYVRYCLQDATGRLVMRTSSEVEQKCCALQHWVHQWTNGNLLLSRLEGVDTKITNVGISVKSTGYQGLSSAGNPKVFEQFVSQHQCSYYCGLLGLRPLKTIDTLQTPSKAKGPRSPMLHRKMASGSASPQTGRKVTGSPRLPRKSESDQDISKGPAKPKPADVPRDIKMS